MIRHLTLVVGFVLSVLLNGCSSTQPSKIPLPQGAEGKVTSSNIIVLVNQHEITPEVERSQVATAMGGGLIPALIDVAVESSRSKTAEQTIRPVRDALENYDLGEEFRKAAEQPLSGVSWLRIQRTEIKHEQDPDVLSKLLSSNSEDALILINPSYSLSSDLNALKTNAVLMIYPRSATLKSLVPTKDQADKPAVPLYKNTVSHVYNLAPPPSDKEAAAIAWSANQGEAIKKALKESVNSLAIQLATGLQSPSAQDK